MRTIFGHMYKKYSGPDKTNIVNENLWCGNICTRINRIPDVKFRGDLQLQLIDTRFLKFLK